MKRLIVCCDGTWQKLSSPYPTNVVKIAQAIKPSCSKGIPQIVFYDEGVGSGNMTEKLFAEGDKIIGGAFGIGIDNNIQNAYRFLSLNYEPDNEIYLFGFSRGSYAVRSLAGLIRCSGGLLSLKNIREAPLAYELYRDRALTLKEKEQFRKLPIPHAYRDDAATIKECRIEVHQIYSDRHSLSFEKAGEGTVEAQNDLSQKKAKVQALLSKYGLSERQDSEIRQAAKITLLGCWDTVGSLGVPATVPFLSDWINQNYEFHDCILSSIIQNALHAVAIDEHREVFNVTPMERKQNDVQPLHQIWFPGGHGCIGGGSRAERALSDAALEWMMDQINNSAYRLGLGLEFDRAVAEDGIAPDHKGEFNTTIDLSYRVLGIIERHIPAGQFDILHESVKKRWRDCPDYCPKNLKDHYEKQLKEWCQMNP
jgi:uncharacterized protein (DUF2235 family)